MKIKLDKTAEGALVLITEAVSPEGVILLDGYSELKNCISQIGYGISLFAGSDIAMYISRSTLRGAIGNRDLAELPLAEAKIKASAVGELKYDGATCDDWFDLEVNSKEVAIAFFSSCAQTLHAYSGASSAINSFISWLYTNKEVWATEGFIPSICKTVVLSGNGYIVPIFRPYFKQAIYSGATSAKALDSSNNPITTQALINMQQLYEADDSEDLTKILHNLGLNEDSLKLMLEPCCMGAYLYTTPKSPDGVIAAMLTALQLLYFVPDAIRRKAKNVVVEYFNSEWKDELKQVKDFFKDNPSYGTYYKPEELFV